MGLNTLRLRLTLALLLALAASAAVVLWQVEVVRGAQALAATLLGVLWVAARGLAPLRRVLRSLESAALSYRDGDFSVSVATGRDDELGELVRQHNALGHALRQQRLALVQRELLLDTVVQNTPGALVLTDAHQRVAYADLAARQLLGQGRSLEGSNFAATLASAPAALLQAVAAGVDAPFSVTIEGAEESFHLSQRDFHLQGRPHRPAKKAPTNLAARPAQ